MGGEHDKLEAKPDDQRYVSRGGLKLRHALNEFGIDPRGWTCADLGCSTGGFTDCLLQAGAARVYSVDTAYGELAWSLRQDGRVVVLERTNALHAEPPPEAGEGVDLVVIDLGWTKQDKAIPAALCWLKPGGRIITLIKPHYESPRQRPARGGKSEPLTEEEAARIAQDFAAALPALGVRVEGMTRSPILGGKAGKGAAKGNVEYLALVKPP